MIQLPAWQFWLSLAAAVGLTFLVVANWNGQEEPGAYDSGYDIGKEDGYAEGFEDGYYQRVDPCAYWSRKYADAQEEVEQWSRFASTPQPTRKPNQEVDPIDGLIDSILVDGAKEDAAEALAEIQRTCISP